MSRLARSVLSGAVALGVGLGAAEARAQTVTVDASVRHQAIDGFGTCLSGGEGAQGWWQDLYFDDLQASIVRVDLTPSFKSPVSDLSYCSPWFGQAAPLSLDNNANGPDGTRVRQYTSAADYGASFGGCSAPIAVMGPDIDKNAALFDFAKAQATPVAVVKAGMGKASQLGGFKLYGSLWSPAPWVKISSGNKYSGGSWPAPAAGVSWPFIWGGNFAGGRLDVSGTPLSVFDDGSGPTSALVQFARGLAAYLHGFQQASGATFWAISIQNELNFEEYYNSATYPLAAQYLAALKAARAELDQHDDLKAIRIIGPEDLMGGDAYGMWQYGGGATETDKNLHYLDAVAKDAAASSALAGFAIHGYGSDGASAAGADSQLWGWWADGWTSSPAAGIPGSVKGFTAFGKPSWMTETSGEKPEWLSPASGFPSNGAFSIAVKIHQALTTGQQSAWLYWQLTDGKASDDSHVETLTDATQLGNGPKYVAAKHFFRHVRPGAQRVDAKVAGSSTLLASAFVHDSAGAVTVVLVNEASSAAAVDVALPASPAVSSLAAYTSSSGKLWQATNPAVASGHASVSVPGYGVVTLYGTGAVAPAPDAGVPLGRDSGSAPAADASTSGRDGAYDPEPDASPFVTADAGSPPAAADGSSNPPVEAADGGGAAAGVSSSCGCQSSPALLSGALLLVLAAAFRPRRGSRR